MNALERFHTFLLGLESAVQIEVGKAFREVAEEVTQEPNCRCLLRSTLRAGSSGCRAEEWTAPSARSRDPAWPRARGSAAPDGTPRQQEPVAQQEGNLTGRTVWDHRIYLCPAPYMLWFSGEQPGEEQ